MKHRTTVGIQSGANLNMNSLAHIGTQTFKSFYKVECFDKDGNLKWVEDIENTVVNQGLDDVLDKYFKGSTYTASWFVGLINNASFGGINATDTTGRIVTSAGAIDYPATTNNWYEDTNYDEAVRQTLTLGSVSSQSVDNSASKAVFTMASTQTINGAFVVSLSTKGGTTGVLYGAASFASPRAVEDNDVLNVTVTLTSASA